MSIDVSDEAPAKRRHHRRRRRSRAGRVLHWLRRGHLYLGLFLFPWAVLYGVTAFLFNHPFVFADRKTDTFGPEILVGTPMSEPPSAHDWAEKVVASLQERAEDGVRYELVSPDRASFNRDNAFATVKRGEGTTNIAIDALGRGGTVRAPSEQPAARPAKAPFAIAPARGGRIAGGNRQQNAPAPADNKLALDQPLHERVKSAAPVVLERLGYPSGEITVTSVPDLTFFMTGHEKTWRVTWNAMTGSVAGEIDDGTSPDALSWRQFLLRLHTTHGYPSSGGARWFWAIIVDTMAFVMVFWGASGLLMWWQIKSPRTPGAVVLTLSTIVAAALGVGMHMAMVR